MVQEAAAAPAAGGPGELCDSADGYNGELARWWQTRADDPIHSYAYRKISDYIHASFSCDPGLIVDYACGAGHLIERLSKHFTSSRFVGLDGSSFLLNQARQRLVRCGAEARKRITLAETLLPNFDLAPLHADMLIYSFPNLLPSRAYEDLLGSDDHAVGEFLICSPECAEKRSNTDYGRILQELMFGRVVSLNLRRLLRRGGTCVRVEYAKVRRHELSLADFMRIAFEEGSLDAAVAGRVPACMFRVMASAFFRSRVTEDVYQQTGDESDRGGGYVITSLRAL